MIDAHFHVWDANRRDHSWLSAVPMLEKCYDIRDYTKEADRVGLKGAILIQVLNDADETNEFLSIAHSSAFVRGVVGWIDLRAPDVAERIGALKESEHGKWLVGVRHLIENEDVFFLQQPEVLRGLEAVASNGLVFDFMGRPEQLASAHCALEHCESLRMVLDRAGKPDLSDLNAHEWKKTVEALANTGRVVAKFAGFANEAGPEWSLEDIQPAVDVLLETFGPSSILFGSDWPVCLAVANLDELMALNHACFRALTTSEMNDVMGENARRFYQLSA